MEVTAWLFVRGEQSVRIVRNRTQLELSIDGPGADRQRREFADEDALLQFQRSFEQRLTADGWELQSMHERRSGLDRRAVPRGPDRRRAADP